MALFIMYRKNGKKKIKRVRTLEKEENQSYNWLFLENTIDIRR